MLGVRVEEEKQGEGALEPSEKEGATFSEV